MKRIHRLSPLLISKIAAGQVIERPSFAVKELVENAIDAGATEIKVYIEASGLEKIQIVDNGEGMSEEDVQEAWKPHTTSKLQDELELHAIKNFGFRGEALASLSAVSKITLQSRINNQQVGFGVVVENGKVVRSSPVGMAPGTIVIAEQLFASIPARKKFLKSPQTELRHIVEVMNHFAVSYPQIKFTLAHGKRTLLEYPVTKDITERIEQLVGQDTFSFFIPVKKAESYVRLTGYIAKPQINSSTQTKQFLFVNKRKITDKLLSQAVKESFGTMLESTAYPLFVLFIELPFEMVDVNVHPRKEHVSFVNNQFIFQTIKQCISEVLEENNITFQNLSWKRRGVGQTHSFAGKLLKEHVLDKEQFIIDEKAQFLQLDRLYIISPTQHGLVLIDQHAAHERVLFEKLYAEFIRQKNEPTLFRLETPYQLHLTESEKVLFEEHKKVLKNLGFDFVVLSKVRNSKKISPHKIRQDDNVVVLTHLPTLFQDRNPGEFIRNILENLSEEKAVDEVDTVSEEMLAFLACRAATKAGDALTQDQMRHIVSELESTHNSATCPHGRPTRILVEIDELNALFKR